MNKIVPLVVFENGERKVIGEASLETKGDRIEMHALVSDQKYTSILNDDWLKSFSLQPMLDGTVNIGAEWQASQNNQKWELQDGTWVLSGDVPMQALLRAPNRVLDEKIDQIERAQVEISGQHYSVADLPTLDKAHDVLGLREWWLASARRAHIANIKDPNE